MNQNDIKTAFYELVKSAPDAETVERLAMAQQAAIAYYYDVLSARCKQMFSKAEHMEYVPVENIQEAVRTINQACANQKKPYLFDGEIDDFVALFRFTREIIKIDAAAK